MTQLLFDGRKAVNVDLLVGNEGWTTANGSAPLPEEVRLYYEYVGLLYRCTHIRADSLSKVPWAIVNSADKTLWEKGQPCPPQLLWLKSLPRLLYKSEAALSLASEAFWHKERNRVKVTGLRWFAPIATTPYWDTRLGLTHFERNVGVGLEKYPTDEIVYLRYEHPLHETLRDRSPAEAAMAAAGVLYNVDQFVANFFERGAIKATLLTVKGNPAKEEKDRLKAWWNRVFSGIKNAFKTDVISADAVTPVVVGEGIQELSNTDLTGEKRSDVAITLGVPLSMVFSDAANYATAEQDEKNFYNSTIVPDCELMAEQINEELLGELGLHLVFRPEAMDIYQEDENEKAQSFAVLVNAGIKRSVAAEMLGMELPDGVKYDDLDDVEEEEPAQPVNAATTPADGAQPPVTNDEEDDPAKASEVRRFRAWARKRKDPNPDAFHSRLLSAADKAAILSELKGGGAGQDFFTLPTGAITPSVYKALLLQLDPNDDEAEQSIRMGLERDLERNLAKALQEQLTTLLPDDASDDAIRAAAGQVDATSQPVREALRRELERSSSLGVTVALDTLERIGLGFDWTLANVEASRWASQYSYELVRGINNTTAQRLQVAVNDWFQERTTLPDLVKELQPTFGRKRARLIAQTETTRAAREGSVIGFEKSGVVQEVEIRTSRDERVCVICGPLHGTRVPLRGASYPPYHPSCRCWVAPVVKEAGETDREARPTPQERAPTSQVPNWPKFNGAEEGQAWAEQNFAAWHEQTQEDFQEYDILTAFKGSKSGVVNGHLRGYEVDGANPKLAQHMTKYMDQSFARPEAVVNRDVTVWRGMRSDLIDELRAGRPLDSVQGLTFKDKGFAATSLSEDVASKGYGVHGVVAEIRVRSGAKAIYMDMPGFHTHDYKEYEMLLPRDTQFKVLSAKEDGGLTRLILEVVS